MTNAAHTTLIPAGLIGGKYAVRIQVACYGVAWLSERMPVPAAKALRRELGL